MGSSIQLQCLLGVQCKDFVAIAADQTNSQSILVMKNDEEKIFKISDSLILGVVGDPGHAEQFSQFISKNIQLYKMRNTYDLNTAAAVHFTRKNLAEALRSTGAYTVNMLVAGYDKDLGGQLYYIDWLASCMKVPYACHGYGGLLSVGIMDKMYKADLTQPQAVDIIKECVKEVQKRLLINLHKFQIAIIDKNGVKYMPSV